MNKITITPRIFEGLLMVYEETCTVAIIDGVKIERSGDFFILTTIDKE